MPPLPKGFCERFANSFGEKELSHLQIALSSVLAPSIRLHPLKVFAHHLRQVPWCHYGRYGYVEQETAFGADPLWHAGAYYVQEASSMFVAHLLQQLPLKAPKRVLDLCAAPGGKSSLLRSYIPCDTLLIANEIEGKRAKVLHENLTRFGLQETIITSATPQQLRATGVSFDLILVDAPCSGEGMFRKEPAALEGCTESNVALCANRQNSILDEAWAMLEEGGYLIYSTCTYNKEENEAQLAYLESRYPLQLQTIAIPAEWGIWERQKGVYSLMPHRVEGEGLTLFAVQKLGHTQASPKKSYTIQSTTPPKWLSELFSKEYLHSYQGKWYHLSREGEQILQQLKGIKILAAGVLLGEEKGKDFLPAHPWASSASLISKAPFPRYEVTDSQALAFLKRETLTFESERGINLITYKGLPLGFAKQVGNRLNNLYPRELMIRNSRLTTNDIPQWHE